MEDYFNMNAVLSFVSKLHENMSDSAASLGVLCAALVLICASLSAA